MEEKEYIKAIIEKMKKLELDQLKVIWVIVREMAKGK